MQAMIETHHSVYPALAEHPRFRYTRCPPVRSTTGARWLVVRRLIVALASAGAGVVASGCASTLPDVGPFVDATNQFRAAIVSGGRAVDADLRAIAADDQAKQFAAQWEKRVRAADALASYSNAIGALVSAGSEGGAAARGVADSLQGLAGAAGIALPATATIATAVDAAAFIYGHIAAVRASASLAEALRTASPAIDRIASILDRDLGDAESILRATSQMRATQLATQYNTETAYYKGLLEERRKLLARSPQGSADEARLLQLERLIDATQSWRTPQEAEQRSNTAREKAGRQLFAAARESLDAWAGAHRDLATALERRRAVDVRTLIASVEEMRDIIRRIRAL